MKTLTHTNIQVQGNISGEKVAMTFDENSLAHIMSVLTDLYSDPELAIIREYSTNAYDAHVEAGQTRPIEITLPNPLSFNLTIRDYGCGLSLEDIYNIYSKYGASTKRDTNDQVGMLGLGCKSALTYTSQFTLTSVKDGRKIAAIVSRDEDGAGSIKIVSNLDTDEPNGTLISIPAKKGNFLESKAKEFFSFWEKGKVLVNGMDWGNLVNEDKNVMKLSDKIFIVPDHFGKRSNANSFVVMGNVPYPVHIEQLYPFLTRGRKAVFYVDIGQVAFTPSRESLYMSSVTKKTLEALFLEFENLLSKKVQEDIDAASDHFEAIKILQNWKTNIQLPVKNYQYKGEVIPGGFNSEDDDRFLWVDSYSYSSLSNYKYSFSVSNIYDPYRAKGSELVLIHNFDITKFTSIHKKKLEALLQSRGKTFNVAVVTKKKYENKWLPSNILRLDFADVKAFKIPSQPAASVVTKTEPDYNSIGSNAPGLGYTAKVSDLKAFTGEIYYIGTNQRSAGYRYKKYLEGLNISYVLVEVASNRVAKFIRLFPNAKEINKHVIDLATAWKDNLTSDQKEIIAYNVALGKYRNHFKILDLNKIDDPAFKQALKILEKPWQKLLEEYQHINTLIPITIPKVVDPFTKYPLLSPYNFQSHPDHAYLYVNAAYKTFKQ